MMITHITTRSAWENAQAAGEYRSGSLETEGFIHCSKPDQVLAVANTFYRRVSDLILLWIEPAQVSSRIAWEEPDPNDPFGGERFPHIYGPLNLDAVRAAVDLLPEGDGEYRRLPHLD